jgi:protein involved in polysaccharide export with SLBB domain
MRLRGNKLNWLAGALALTALAFLPTGCSWAIRQFVGAPPPFPAAVAEEPKINPGITLKITVISAGKSEDFTVTVSQAGVVTLPLINAVKCDGMTLLELQNKLKTVYAQYIQDPQITAQFLFGDGMLSPWGTVLILGKIGREGPVNIPPTCDLTVTRALQLAGGITPLGNQNKVKITRKLKDGTTCSTEVDVEEIGEHGRRENDYVLQAGDVLWVPEINW